MPNNRTTLTVSRELADEIREHEGNNMEERLKNWAEQYEREGAHMWTQFEIESLARDIAHDVVEEAQRR